VTVSHWTSLVSWPSGLVIQLVRGAGQPWSARLWLLWLLWRLSWRGLCPPSSAWVTRWLMAIHVGILP